MNRILCLALTTLLPAVTAHAQAQAQAQAQDGGQVNIICSVQAEWCNLIQTVYARTTGVKVNMSLKGVDDKRRKNQDRTPRRK